MKYPKKIAMTSLCAALYFSGPVALAAPDDIASVSVPAPAAQQRVPLRFRASDGQEGRCAGCWRGFGRCVKQTAVYVEQALPALEVALSFIDNDEVRKHAETAISLVRKGSKYVEVDEQGNITFLKGGFKGETLVNALLLVVNDKAEVLTDESEMMLSLVLSQLSEGNYEDKMKFVAFLAASDNPKTDFHISFDAETGHVGLRQGKATIPFKHINLFEEGMAHETKAGLREYFAEYVRAVDERTKAEAATGGERSKDIYLPKGGKVLTDYQTLIETNPNFKFVDIAEDVLRGDRSVVGALQRIVDTTITSA